MRNCKDTNRSSTINVSQKHGKTAENMTFKRDFALIKKRPFNHLRVQYATYRRILRCFLRRKFVTKVVFFSWEMSFWININIMKTPMVYSFWLLKT